MAVSPDGKFLATGGVDGRLCLWDLKTAKLAREPIVLERDVTSIAWGSSAIVVGTAGGTIQILNNATYKESIQFDAHHGHIVSLAFSSDDKQLVTTASDQTVRVWEPWNRQRRVYFDRFPDSHSMFPLSSDASLMGVWSAKAGIRVWSIPHRRFVREVEVDRRGRVLAISMEGNLLIAGDYDGNVRFWSAGAKAVPILFKVDGKEFDRIVEVAISADAKFVAARSTAGKIQLVEMSSANQVASIDSTSTYGDKVMFSPKGKLLASTDKESRLCIWDHSRKLVHRFADDFGAKALCFSPDGSLLATGDADRVIRVWNLTTKKRLVSWEGHKGAVAAIAFTHDGKYVASGSVDTSVLIWKMP